MWSSAVGKLKVFLNKQQCGSLENISISIYKCRINANKLRRWCFFANTQLIGAYGTQWVPCSFEVWVCSRIIMSLIWDQFSKDTREKLPKKYSLHQENIFCQRGQVHFSIDRWHCNKSFYQWISPLKYYKIHKIELQSFCYHIIY